MKASWRQVDLDAAVWTRLAATKERWLTVSRVCFRTADQCPLLAGSERKI